MEARNARTTSYSGLGDPDSPIHRLQTRRRHISSDEPGTPVVVTKDLPSPRNLPNTKNSHTNTPRTPHSWRPRLSDDRVGEHPINNHYDFKVTRKRSFKRPSGATPKARGKKTRSAPVSMGRGQMLMIPNGKQPLPNFKDHDQLENYLSRTDSIRVSQRRGHLLDEAFVPQYLISYGLRSKRETLKTTPVIRSNLTVPTFSNTNEIILVQTDHPSIVDYYTDFLKGAYGFDSPLHTMHEREDLDLKTFAPGLPRFKSDLEIKENPQRKKSVKLHSNPYKRYSRRATVHGDADSSSSVHSDLALSEYWIEYRKLKRRLFTRKPQDFHTLEQMMLEDPVWADGLDRHPSLQMALLWEIYLRRIISAKIASRMCVAGEFTGTEPQNREVIEKGIKSVYGGNALEVLRGQSAIDSDTSSISRTSSNLSSRT